ncbi:MAG: hypothetical protein ACYTGR_04090 [Planctomycetota bacterium]|jgi:hypothetical protein
MDDWINNQDASPEGTLGHVQVEPLGEGYDAELLEIDALLSANAARTSIPRDLSNLVYDVTVGLVLKRQTEPLRLTRAAPVWGRLAMAAALGLAFMVAIWSLSTQSRGVDPGIGGALASAAEEILMQEGVNEDSGLWYLLETRDATSTDLVNDLEQVVSELEL